MNMKLYRCRSALLSGVWLITRVFLLLLTSKAYSGVIDKVEIDDKTDPAEIRISFTIPLQYLTHTPESTGDELQIQFQNVSTNLFSRESVLDSQQTVTASPGSLVPLLDARYEQAGPKRGLLTIRFSRRTRFSLQAGSDRRHITIRIPSPSVEPAPVDRPMEPRISAKSGNEKQVRVGIKEDILRNPYVINLQSTIKKVKIPSLDDIKNRERYTVYVTQFAIEGRVWNRLRIGFFPDRASAQKFLPSIKSRYPRAWVAVATEEEILSAVKITLPKPDAKQVSRQKPIPVTEPTLPSVTEEQLREFMEEARQAVARKDYSRAVQLYTKVLRYPDHPYRQDALEFLGVARERKGQLAHAINEYNRYLSLYPDGEGAERVQQRLAGLTTASKTPQPGAARSKPRREAEPWDIYGGLSQFYRRDESVLDVGGRRVDQSALSTDLDVTARRRSDTYDIQSRFTGSYLYDFLSNGSDNETSVSSLYFGVTQKQLDLFMRVGRQSRNTGGVLGRFDGLLLGYKLSDWLTLNAVGGYPVLATRDGLHTGKYLYGISADLGTFADAWDFNTFFIEQKADGILDRRAIGGEARYFDPIRSLLTFVDYDISYDSLNTFIFLGTWTLPDRTTVNATVDYRNSPILTTSNALQGQAVNTIDDLLDSLSKKELRQLAQDRTGESTTVTLGASHPFTERLQVSGDVTVSNLSDTPASGGVEAIPGTGKEYFYNLQLIGSSLVKNGDIGILGLRYSNTSTARIGSVALNTRYPVNRDWRINPRLRVDHRKNDNDNSTQWITAPSLRMDYRWRRRFQFEAEGGGEWSTRELSDDTEDNSSYFLSLGYRADF